MGGSWKNRRPAGRRAPVRKPAARRRASALHLSQSAERYSPAEIVELCRQWMGGIDLDPASCAEANEIVRATKYYTKEDDGLLQPWFGRVFVNPPGDRTGQLPRRFWARLMRFWRSDGTSEPEVTQFCYLGFSLEQLRTLQDAEDGEGPWAPQHFPICYPRKRLHFSGLPQPTHGNFLAFGGGDLSRLHDLFVPLGPIVVPYHYGAQDVAARLERAGRVVLIGSHQLQGRRKLDPSELN